MCGLTDEVGDGSAVGESSGGAAEEAGSIGREIRLNGAIWDVGVVSGVQERVPKYENCRNFRSDGGSC